jgi:hypothetical protein
VRFRAQTIPTHAKYVMCHRANATPTAIFGGVNIGDRFKPWRDFAIRAEGKAIIGALSLNINGPMGGGIVGGRGGGGGGGDDGSGSVSGGGGAVARSAREMLRQGVALSVVGLSSRIQFTRSLKIAWFQPLCLKCDLQVSKFAFKFNLYRYSVGSRHRVPASDRDARAGVGLYMLKCSCPIA